MNGWFNTGFAKQIEGKTCGFVDPLTLNMKHLLERLPKL